MPTALVNGDFDGDDSAWTPWIVSGPVEIDLSYTDDGPTGGSGEALRVVASDWGNGGVYQAVNLEEVLSPSDINHSATTYALL